MVLYTLPLPLPCNNYPMVFAPEQRPDANEIVRPSYPLHQAPIPDLRPEDGPKVTEPITLGRWVQAEGELEVELTADGRGAVFRMEFGGLVPSSLYTVMSLRQHDLDPAGPTRPGPLGVPNVFVTDEEGRAQLPRDHAASLPGARHAGSEPDHQCRGAVDELSAELRRCHRLVRSGRAIFTPS